MQDIYDLLSSETQEKVIKLLNSPCKATPVEVYKRAYEIMLLINQEINDALERCVRLDCKCEITTKKYTEYQKVPRYNVYINIFEKRS